VSKADELVRGSIDMHFHSYPEFGLDTPCRFPLEEHARLMLQAGMKGVVLKSHFWPTTERVLSLRQVVPELEVFASITLNSSVGGIKKWALEAAVKQGARVVWMPTWSAKSDILRNGVTPMVRRYFPSFEEYTQDDAITIIDEQGVLSVDATEILSLINAYDIALFTGHISPLESLALAREAKRIGFKKLVFGHPDGRSVGASSEQIVEMADLGAYVEICALGIMPLFMRTTPRDLKRTIETVGARRCILSTDSFFEWLPSSPEMLRLLIASLLEVGVREEEIREMAQLNPKRLLNLE